MHRLFYDILLSMKSIIKFIKTRYVISIGIAVAIIAIGIFSYLKLNSGPKFQTITPTHQKIVQSVSMTGQVKPSTDANLAFERSGTISRVYFDVGSQVKVGDTIVSLQSADLAGDLAQAEAQLQKEQIKLDNLEAGNRPEDIAISQSQLETAKTVLATANVSAINAIQDSFSKADNAVRYRVDKLFYNGRSFSPTLNFIVDDPNLKYTITAGRVDSEAILKDFSTQSQSLSVTDDLSTALSLASSRLNKIKNFIDTLSGAVNSLVAGFVSYQTTIDGYKTDVSAARSDISAAISEVLSAQNARDNAISSVATAQSQFNLQKAGSTLSDVDVQIAQVKTQASLVAIKQAALSKNFLRSPIDGVVSKQDAKIGQIAPAGITLVSVISNSEFQIEANVPEASISKVNIGNPAKVILDAYPDGTTFDASIIKIDPAETIVDGVPTYKVTFEFSKVDDRIRSGMTASIEVVSASKDNALIVPQRAVFYDQQGSYVSVVRGGVSVKVRVQTGIRGSDGNIEIVQGLNESDMVVVQ